MKIEYTVLQAQNPRDRKASDIRRAAMTVGCPLEKDKSSERSALALDPVWKIGRDDSAGDNETFSRPPKDLGGALRYSPALQVAVSQSYDSLARGGLQYSLRRGRVANTVAIYI